MKTKTKVTLVSFFLSLILLAAPVLAGAYHKAGAEETAANIKDLFSYTDAAMPGYGAKAATSANGLPAYLTDGSMQVYKGSSLTQDYSYMNQGAYVKLQKKHDVNANSTIVTKNFNIADNTADQLLLKFIPAQADNGYAVQQAAYKAANPGTEGEVDAPTLWKNEYFTRLRDITVKIVDVYDENNYKTAEYKVRMNNDASFAIAGLFVYGNNQAIGAQRGTQSTALNTAAGALVPDYAWAKYNEPQELYYDAAENKMYAKIISLESSLAGEGCGKQLVRDFNSTYDGVTETWGGFTTGEVRMEISYTGGTLDGAMLITDLDGVNLATDDEGFVSGDAVSANFYRGVNKEIIENNDSPLPETEICNLLKDPVAATADGFKVNVFNAQGEDVTASAVKGLGENNLYSSDAVMNVSAGEYKVLYSKESGEKAIAFVTVKEIGSEKMPTAVFDYKEGDGIGKAEISLPFENGQSTLPAYMSAFENQGILFDSGNYMNNSGSMLTKVSATVPSVNISDNTKTDSLITLTPMSTDDGENKDDGIVVTGVVVYEKADPSNYFVVTIFHFDKVTVHATAAATGQLTFGYRDNQSATAQSGNQLLGYETLGAKLYKISYDKEENAVYINDKILRDFDWVVNAGGDMETTGEPKDRGTAWSGFKTDEVSLQLINFYGSGKVLVTDVDGQNLGFTAADGIIANTSPIKNEIFNRTLKGATGSEITPDPLTSFNLFDGFTPINRETFIKIVKPDGSFDALGAYSDNMTYVPKTAGTYKAEYYDSADYSNLIGQAYLIAYDGSLEDAFSVSDGAGVFADGTTIINNLNFDYKGYAQNQFLSGLNSAKGMMLTGGHNATFTLDRTLYLGDNDYVSDTQYDTVVELCVAPEYLRFELSNIVITLTDPVTGKFVSVTVKLEEPDLDPETQMASALSGELCYITVSAPNGKDGSDITGQLRHDKTGYSPSKITLRSAQMNGRKISSLKIIYDAEENALYAMDVANSNLSLLRHFSPTEEQREEFGYPDDYENWSGFTGGEAQLSVKFNIFDGGVDAGCEDYRYTSSGNPDTAHVLICQVDGQSLGLENGSYAFEKKTLAAPEDITGRTGEKIAIPAPRKYSLFADGGLSADEEFEGTVKVTKGNDEIVAETAFAEVDGFVPQSSGDYTITYAYEGNSVSSVVKVYKTLTVGDVGNTDNGVVKINGAEVKNGDSFAIDKDLVVTFEPASDYAVTSFKLGDVEYVSEIVGNSFTVTADIANDSETLSVVFSAVYTLTLMDGDSVIQVINIIQGQEYPTLDDNDFIKDGYTFGGWFADKEFTAPFDFDQPVTGNKTAYAKYTVIGYNVVYEADGGVLSGEYTKKYTVEDTEITLPSVSKDGYEFGGWYLSEEFTGAAVTSGEYDFAAGGITLYAKWTAVEYDVVYEADGGVLSGEYTQKYTVEDTEITLPSVSKDGYEFGGWYLSEEFTGAAVTSGEYDFAAGGITLYAKWTAVEYDVVYEANGGTISGEYTQKYTVEDTEITLPSVSKDGYEFGGWYASATFEGEEVTSGEYDFAAGGITLYAKFTLKTFTVTFEVNGGTAVDSITLEKGALVIAPVVTREGYEFGGWYTDEALTNAYEFGAAGIESDLTLYAKWTAVESEQPVAPPADDGGKKSGCGGENAALIFTVLTALAFVFVIKRR